MVFVIIGILGICGVVVGIVHSTNAIIGIVLGIINLVVGIAVGIAVGLLVGLLFFLCCCHRSILIGLVLLERGVEERRKCGGQGRWG